MKTQNLPICFLFLHISLTSLSQDYIITKPVLNFNGEELNISYDFVTKNPSDQFYVWVEIEKSNGETIPAKAFSGDFGENIKAGREKRIVWLPGQDEVFLDEEVFVEVKAERYVKAFNKGSALLMSAVLPGLGHTKISKGKPWWLTGVAAYGALAGGFILHGKYIDSYDSYRIEEDPSVRTDLLDKAQQQKNMSGALIISGAALWAANVFWVALTPNRYQPLQNFQLSMCQPAGIHRKSAFLTYRLTF